MSQPILPNQNKCPKRVINADAASVAGPQRPLLQKTTGHKVDASFWVNSQQRQWSLRAAFKRILTPHVPIHAQTMAPRLMRQ